MNISNVLSTAVSALAAGSARVATSAQNIANVNTDGYVAKDSAAHGIVAGQAFGAGALQIESIEPSNVNLDKEFMDMIVAKAAYEANAKVLRTGEEMLKDAIDIKD